MSHNHLYEADDMDYQGGATNRFASAKRETVGAERRPAHGRRRGKAPQSVNGIHRRRRRKMNW